MLVIYKDKGKQRAAEIPQDLVSWLEEGRVIAQTAMLDNSKPLTQADILVAVLRRAKEDMEFVRLPPDELVKMQRPEKL